MCPYVADVGAIKLKEVSLPKKMYKNNDNSLVADKTFPHFHYPPSQQCTRPVVRTTVKESVAKRTVKLIKSTSHLPTPEYEYCRRDLYSYIGYITPQRNFPNLQGSFHLALGCSRTFIFFLLFYYFFFPLSSLCSSVWWQRRRRLIRAISGHCRGKKTVSREMQRLRGTYLLHLALSLVGPFLFFRALRAYLLG